jgi:hypothetical protein
MVKTIELTQGQHALVDDQDFDFLNQWKWYANYNKALKGFYAQMGKYIGVVNGKQKMKIIRMHRLIMERVIGRELKRNEVIDHENHNPLDNRLENLRIVSHRQNLQNQKRKTSSKYPGVYWHKRDKKWIARITLNSKRKHLGSFVNEVEAFEAYKSAVHQLTGEKLACELKGG